MSDCASPLQRQPLNFYRQVHVSTHRLQPEAWHPSAAALPIDFLYTEGLVRNSPSGIHDASPIKFFVGFDWHEEPGYLRLLMLESRLAPAEPA